MYAVGIGGTVLIFRWWHVRLCMSEEIALRRRAIGRRHASGSGLFFAQGRAVDLVKHALPVFAHQGERVDAEGSWQHRRDQGL